MAPSAQADLAFSFLRLLAAAQMARPLGSDPGKAAESARAKELRFASGGREEGSQQEGAPAAEAKTLTSLEAGGATFEKRPPGPPFDSYIWPGARRRGSLRAALGGRRGVRKRPR